MKPQSKPPSQLQSELEELLAKASALPGIASMLKAYDDAEEAYGRVSAAANPPEFTASSTNVTLAKS